MTLGRATSYLLWAIYSVFVNFSKGSRAIFTSLMVFVKSTLANVFIGHTAVTKNLDPRSKNHWADQVGPHFVIATHNTVLFKSLKSYEILSKVKVGDLLMVDSRPRRIHGYLMHLLVSPPWVHAECEEGRGLWPGGGESHRPQRYTCRLGSEGGGQTTLVCVRDCWVWGANRPHMCVAVGVGGRRWPHGVG